MAMGRPSHDSFSDLSDDSTIDLPEWGTGQASSLPAPQPQSPALESQLQRKIINAAYIALNAVSTVAIVFLNKTIFLDPQLKKCQVSTAMYHFSITFLVLLLCSSHPTIRLFDAKRLPFLPMLPICLFFAGSIVLSNLSLSTNSVGFFQLTKILTTPCVVLLSYLMFRIKTNRMRLVAVAACCIGVAMTNTKQALTNPIGAIVATAAFVVTALYQIYIGRQMQVLDASAPQLLMNQAPISVFMLVFVMPFFDTVPDFALIPHKVIAAFLCSGLVAASINYSQFMIIGRTSPLTFNIVGMFKIVLVIVLSYFYEAESSFSLIEIAGILLALGGTWIYGSYPDKKVLPVAAGDEEARGTDPEYKGLSSEDYDEEMSMLPKVEPVEEKLKEEKETEAAVVSVRERASSSSSGETSFT